MISAENTALIVIDVQGNLAYKMHDKEFLFQNIISLIRAAKHLNIPTIYTEQAPEKIGVTVPEIKEHLRELSPIIKTSFSCCGEESFLKEIRKLKRKNLILIGIETHVCVFHTVVDLLNQKYEIQVVGDAVSSRTLANKRFALQRMRELGVTITCTEMLATELLQTAKHPKFKEVLALIR